MYQALYRKWRPRSFDDVAGQEHITQTLKRQIETGRLSHAYLFVGTRGTGKTTCAKILAKAANCEHPVNGNPCNECASCRGIDSGAILDVEELDAASNNGVENIRAIRDEAMYTPAAVRRRVYIVDEVHMLSASAFNALLKILEEPPAHLIFILATTELQKVPATILSRCQRFSFKRLMRSQIADRMQYICEKEGIDLRPDAAELLARLADGSMRDALSLLDQCRGDSEIDAVRVREIIGVTGTIETADLFTALSQGDTSRALSLFDGMYYGGKEPSAVLRELLTLERDILMHTVAPKTGEGLLSGAYDSQTLAALADCRGAERILSDINAVQAALTSMFQGADRRMAAEMCLISICQEELSEDVSALRSRVAGLEEKLRSGAAVPVMQQTASKPEPAPKREPVKQKEEDPVPWEEAAEPVAVKEAPAAEPEKVHREEPPHAAEEPDSPAPTAEGEPNFPAAWQQILDIVAPKLEIPENMFLSDKSHVVPSLSGMKLAVGARSVIAKNMLDRTEVTIPLKEAAEKVLGRAVTVAVTMYTEPENKKEDKLEALRRFGNVQFK